MRWPMKITEAIAMEHVILSSVFDEVERALPRLESAAEVARMASILERLLEIHEAGEVTFAFLPLDHALYQQGQLDRMHHDRRE